jgi:hypothetical protein
MFDGKGSQISVSDSMARKNYCRSVFVLIIVLTLMPAGHAFAQYDRSGPWWAKLQRPMLGVAYTAEPSDYNNTAPIGNPARNVCNDPSACKYFDSDFTNADFSLLWGPAGRDDLDAIRKLKMNFIALYDWVGGSAAIISRFSLLPGTMAATL